MSELEELLAQYDYEVDEAQIALSPASPRDSAKLLVYNPSDESVTYDTFANLAQYLPKGALLVFNDTKVIPARLHATRSTGGRVEILCTKVLSAKCFTAIANKKLTLSEDLTIGDDAIVLEENDGEYIFRSSRPVLEVLAEHGETPIPPYLKHTPLPEERLREEYQTMFAKDEGSAAAPTASLHFTPELLDKLHAASIETTTITLHVSLGTFAPLTEAALAEGKLHEEWYEIASAAAETISRAKTDGRPVIPVGTTALRTLESAADETGSVAAGSGSTRLFIQPGYAFKIADGLITNFHVPKSSLLMLVAALTGREKLLALYQLAKEKGFRFFSFGDGMVVLPRN